MEISFNNQKHNFIENIFLNFPQSLLNKSKYEISWACSVLQMASKVFLGSTKHTQPLTVTAHGRMALLSATQQNPVHVRHFAALVNHFNR